MATKPSLTVFQIWFKNTLRYGYMHGRWCMMQVPVTSSATGRIASGEEVCSMGNLSRDEISTLKVVRKTGRIASLPIPIFLKLIGLGLL
ncbi:MAG: hypothetical protein QF652_04170, partial [Dehalococcoidia bacterium]|nr:hypothetical protein [Dehalococcoidia bacterium]